MNRTFGRGAVAGLLAASVAVAIAGRLATRNHWYLSTSCLHGEHAYCQSHTGKSGAKVPSKCKWCPSRCVCSCHAGKTADV